MKKFLLSLFLLFSLAVTAAAAGTDVLTNASLNGGTAKQDNQYKEITSYIGASGATYAGKLAFVKESNLTCIQLNSKASTGADLVTTVSGGVVKSVKFNWSTKATAGRGVTIYGQNTAYTSGDKGKGTNIGSATTSVGGSSEVDLSKSPYKYIAIGTSANKVVYIESIEIEWVAAEKPEVPVTGDDVEVTYDPNSPTLDLSKNLPADLLSDAKANLNYSDVEGYVGTGGTIMSATGTNPAKVTVSWDETDKYKKGDHTFNVTIHKAKNGIYYTADAYTATMGEKNAFPELKNDYGLTVEYISTEEKYATIAADGKVTLVAPGETDIMASTNGNILFEAATPSYKLTVKGAGAPATPTFKFADGETYLVGSKLTISCTTEGAQIYYAKSSTEAGLATAETNDYNAPIECNEVGEYYIKAWSQRSGEEITSEVAKIHFTVVKDTYAYDFSNATQLELGTDRIFTPELAGLSDDLKKEVKYDVIYDEGVLEPMRGTANSYLITGAGDIMVTATIAESVTHNAFSKELTVTVKEQNAGGSATIVCTNKDDFGLTEATLPSFGNGITLTSYDQILCNGITMKFTKQQSASNPSKLWNNKTDGIDLRIYQGNYFELIAPDNANIKKIEFTFHSNNEKLNAFTAQTEDGNSIGSLTTQSKATDVRTWTPEGVKTDRVVFSFTATARITQIDVEYGSDPATTYNLKFDKAVYEFEVGDKLPAVNVPEGYTATYVFNGTKVENPETFVFTEDINNAELYAYAFTGKDDKYLPAVAYAIADVKPIILPGHLTIHYSNADGFSMASFATETEGAENEYVFNDIEVTGYDSVDGHYYGHVFFSFYKPAEAAGAPRRAAEDDWSAVNSLVTYTPAEHLTIAELGSTEPLTLVRNKANTFTGMPNAFRVPSSHETGKAVNFTVKLTENGTPATVAVAGGIQTGVESVGVDADGEAEYYTLQGVRVAKPAAGIYLRRQGGTVSKVLVK